MRVGLWRSTVGRKALVAVSGLVLVDLGGPARGREPHAVLRRPRWPTATRRRPAPGAGLAVGGARGAGRGAGRARRGVVSLARAGRAARPRHAAAAAAHSSALAPARMRVGGALLLALRRLPPAAPHGGRPASRLSLPATSTTTSWSGCGRSAVAAIYVGAAARSSGCTSSTACGRRRAASASGPTWRRGGGAPRWRCWRRRSRSVSRRCPLAVLAGWLR